MIDNEKLVVGEKKISNEAIEIIELRAFIERYKAASPTDPNVYWIHLKPKEIASKFETESGFKISHGLVKRQLLAMNFSYRKLSKQLATGHCEDRDKQFKVIFSLVAITTMQTPIISIDCKKKERLGNLYRDGKCYVSDALKVYDHDYEYLSEGKVIPHGIYDLSLNKGYVSIGNSSETAEFIADNLIWWWDNFGIHQYPDAHSIVILCDAGGANSYRHYVFKKQMLRLCEIIGKTLIICHYPPYASKWNPIEHRLFAHIHRAMQGVVLSDYHIVKELIEKTTTLTGLEVIVRIVDKNYRIGQKTNKDELDFKRIRPHPVSPKLSYSIAA